MSRSLNPYAKNGTFRNRKRQSPAGSAHKLSVASGPLSFDKSKMTLTSPCSDFEEWFSVLIFFEPELRVSVGEFITGFRKCLVSRISGEVPRPAISLDVRFARYQKALAVFYLPTKSKSLTFSRSNSMEKPLSLTISMNA